MVICMLREDGGVAVAGPSIGGFARVVDQLADEELEDRGGRGGRRRPTVGGVGPTVVGGVGVAHDSAGASAAGG